MEQSFCCISISFRTCALSVQKIYFNFEVPKTIVYSFQTRFWQGFEQIALKPATSKGFRRI